MTKKTLFQDRLKMIQFLPAFNAILNGTSALLLGAGLYFIKRRNVRSHRLCMASAFMVSVVFLSSYLFYHYHAGSKKFMGEGEFIKTVYFVILLTHTVLAAAVPPLAIITIMCAVKRRFKKHAAIARWTFPIWIYVSVTGVVIYLMLYL